VVQEVAQERLGGRKSVRAVWACNFWRSLFSPPAIASAAARAPALAPAPAPAPAAATAADAAATARGDVRRKCRRSRSYPALMAGAATGTGTTANAAAGWLPLLLLGPRIDIGVMVSSSPPFHAETPGSNSTRGRPVRAHKEVR
jgi:hypothetical protein